MNLSIQEIESVLRHAPQPKAPSELRKRVLAGVRLPPFGFTTRPAVTRPGLAAWLRRWWPALAPASVSLACAVVMVAREMEARNLRLVNARLAEQRVALEAALPSLPASPSSRQSVDASAAAAEQDESARLKRRAAELAADIARLEKLQTENETLRRQAAMSSGPTREELEPLAKAREQAMSIHCVNSLKQIGIAVRMYSEDNNRFYPSNFRVMSNYLNTPNILACPADTARKAAATFATFTDANCSYELVPPPGSDQEPDRVLTRCPIHGHVGLCDGSVHKEVAKTHPEWFIERNQKLYLKVRPEADASPPTNAPSP